MMPRLATLTPLALALALTGCAIGPDYQRPAAALPESFRAEAPAANAPANAVDARWWTLFGDETLNRLVDQALANNADLRLAVARVSQAEALAREAGAAFFPEIDASGSRTTTQASTKAATYLPSSPIPRIRHDMFAGFTTSFELDVWGRLRRANEAGQAGLLASTYARDAIQLSVAGLVAANYLSLRALDAQVAVSEDSLKSREDSQKLVRIRVDAGLSAPIDLLQSEGLVAAAQAQLADQRRLRALAEHQLALIVGDPNLALPAGNLSSLPMPPLPPAGLPADLVEHRPDVRQAEAQLIATNAQIGIAKAGYYPRFTLTGTAGSQSKAVSDLLGPGSGTWSIGAGLLMPILDFGRTAARVDQAKALNEQSLIAWQNTLQTAYKDVRDAMVSLQEYETSESALATRVDRAEKTFSLSKLRYEAGQVGYLEVLDAQRNLNDARLAAIATRQARLTSAVNLFKALGGGWKPAS